MCISILISTGLAASAHEETTPNPAGCTYYKSIEVEAGDSLWSIAEHYLGTTDVSKIQDYIKEIQEINQLSSRQIHEGSYLTVLYYSSVR